MKHSPWNAILYSANLDLCNSVTYGIHIIDWSAFKQASAISDGHVLNLVFLRFGSLCFPGVFSYNQFLQGHNRHHLYSVQIFLLRLRFSLLYLYDGEV